MSAPPLLPAPTVSVVLRASTWPNAFRTLMALTRAGSRALRLETIVIDDGSADETRLALPRLDGVVVQRNETPVGVARARNQGAALAQGELLFFVAEGAEAEPGALAELVRALDTDAAATVAGSSLLTADGSAYRPDLSFEEPGADGETLAAREVVVLPPEALLVRADAFRDAGGFGEAFTAGGEAADLCLRLRQRGGRALRVTGSIMRCRPEPIPAALAAQDEATLLQRWPDVFAPSRAAAAMPAPPPGAGAPLVSIVVPAWNKWEYTYRCLLSLLRNTSGAAFETLVVDNGSTDETAVALPQLEGIRVLRNAENLGFARACNQGAAAARGRHLLFLNNDIEALPGWLPAMLEVVDSDPAVAVVGSKLLFPDGTLQHAGVAISYAAPHPIYPFHLQYRQPAESSTRQLDLSAVTGACMLVRADAYRAVGGFDEAYRNGYEDVDLCFKIRERGWRVVYTPESVLVHHESVSEGRFRCAAENENLLNQRWIGRFQTFDVDRRKTQRRSPPRAGRPAVSVVVPTRDALRTIAPCLEDLSPNLGPSDEIVVADAGSRDCTLRFVEQFSREHPGTVRVVRGPPGGDLVAALQAGLDAASREVTVVLHACVGAPPGFVDEVTAILERRPDAAALGLRAPGAGFCAAGRTTTLRALASSSLESLFQEDVSVLARAVTRLGVGSLLVPGEAAAASPAP